MSATQRFSIYYFYRKSNRGHGICPLNRGCPPFRESVIRGFTVNRYWKSEYKLLCIAYVKVNDQKIRSASLSSLY